MDLRPFAYAAFSAQDAGILLHTILLSAQARGIDSCPLGELATWRHPVDSEFDVPEGAS